VAEFSSHAPGTFCWVELSTTDQKAAVAFYRDLLGWTVDDQPMGPGEVYSMFQLRGKPVAAAYTMHGEERQHGVPPHWNVYVAVGNVDDAVARVQALGGKVLAPAFDAMDVGRMAVVADPTGAPFCLWQAKRHIGVAIKQEPGSLGWTELMTRDVATAERFYNQLFGWTAKAGSPAAGRPYTEFSMAGNEHAGMMPMDASMANVPPNWLSYFVVASCDDVAKKAQQLGGKTIVPAQDVTNVRFAVLQDPQGAVFGVVTMLRR
jgi:predicted enzyme related to lactoylglutathione lyase